MAPQDELLQDAQEAVALHALQRHEEVLDRRSANKRNYEAQAPKFEIGKISWNDYKIRLVQYVKGDRYEQDEPTIKRAIFAGIQGEAFTTISSYSPDKTPYSTMTGDEYLAYLGSFFAPASERGMWRAEYQSRVQRKNETVIPYLAAKWSLWQKLYGDAADDHFEEFEDSALQGFSNRDVAKMVSERDCRNFNELMDCAQKVVAKVNRQIRLKLTDSKNMEGLGTSTMITFNTGYTPMEIGAVEEVQEKKEIKCWSCGGEGHIKRECTKTPMNFRPETAGQNQFSRGGGYVRGQNRGQFYKNRQNYSSRGLGYGRGQARGGQSYNRGGGQFYRGGYSSGSSNRGGSSSRGGWKNNVHEIVENQEENNIHEDENARVTKNDDWDNWQDQDQQQEEVNNIQEVKFLDGKIEDEVSVIYDNEEDKNGELWENIMMVEREEEITQGNIVGEELDELERKTREKRIKTRSEIPYFPIEIMINEIIKEKYEKEKVIFEEEEEEEKEEEISPRNMPDLWTDESDFWTDESDYDWNGDSEETGYISAESELFPEFPEEEEVEGNEVKYTMDF